MCWHKNCQENELLQAARLPVIDVTRALTNLPGESGLPANRWAPAMQLPEKKLSAGRSNPRQTFLWRFYLPRENLSRQFVCPIKCFLPAVFLSLHQLPGNGARNLSCYLLSMRWFSLEEERMMQQSSVSISLSF